MSSSHPIRFARALALVSGSALPPLTIVLVGACGAATGPVIETCEGICGPYEMPSFGYEGAQAPPDAWPEGPGIASAPDTGSDGSDALADSSDDAEDATDASDSPNDVLVDVGGPLPAPEMPC